MTQHRGLQSVLPVRILLSPIGYVPRVRCQCRGDDRKLLAAGLVTGSNSGQAKSWSAQSAENVRALGRTVHGLGTCGTRLACGYAGGAIWQGPRWLTPKTYAASL
jgi:hypothetical protein